MEAGDFFYVGIFFLAIRNGPNKSRVISINDQVALCDRIPVTYKQGILKIEGVMTFLNKEVLRRDCFNADL